MNGLFALDALDDEALDDLPFGVVRLDPAGHVERFNKPEANRLGIQRWRALGRNYLRDIARAATELATAIQHTEPGTCASVDATFRGYHREDHARVDISRADDGRVYLRIKAA